MNIAIKTMYLSFVVNYFINYFPFSHSVINWIILIHIMDFVLHFVFVFLIHLSNEENIASEMMMSNESLTKTISR